MAVSKVDRDSNYMKQHWGTTKLITDYVNSDSRVLQEVMYDPANKTSTDRKELFEEDVETEFNYGIEPTYKLKRGQQLL